jgi:DNA ligase (NAD+)
MIIRPSKIAEYFSKLSLEDLQQIPDIGPAVAESIYNWFHDKHNLELLEKLHKAGVEIKMPKQEAGSKKLEGKSFVLTGELESLTRDEAKEKIRRLGGDIPSSVSKNIDFVVVGKTPGSKYNKARKLGIKIIDEEEFLSILK